jgi:tripartite-type tricarboxylate transporter receptor subunit TctC
MSRTFMVITSLSLLSLTTPAHAQDFPNRPMTMVVPFAAGGAVDVLGRTIAARTAEILGQQIVIENVGGAGGMTGSNRVAKAAPDGYQFVLGSVGTHAEPMALQTARLRCGQRLCTGHPGRLDAAAVGDAQGFPGQ